MKLTYIPGVGELDVNELEDILARLRELSGKGDVLATYYKAIEAHLIALKNLIEKITEVSDELLPDEAPQEELPFQNVKLHGYRGKWSAKERKVIDDVTYYKLFMNPKDSINWIWCCDVDGNLNVVNPFTEIFKELEC